jgi:flavin reductase (DIM6/NTAB) family NADH-FMN oxidoreductase RutF
MTSKPVPHFTPVPLEKAYRLINHGPTVLVSSAHAGVTNVMAAAWSIALDFDPPKVSVVIDKSTLTRQLVESSGSFVLNIPTQAMAQQVLGVGTDSAKTVPDKLHKHQLTTFAADAVSVPLVEGCVGWLVCQVVPEPHNQTTYDLFIATVVGAWADDRVFSNGHWHFDDAPDELRTLHYVAGGQFFVTGASLTL